MSSTYYLSGRAGGITQVLRVQGRTVEQTAQLGRLLGLEEATILVALWPKDNEVVDFIEITPSVHLAVWPGRTPIRMSTNTADSDKKRFLRAALVTAIVVVLVAITLASCGKKTWPTPVVPALSGAVPAGTWVETTGATNSMGDLIPPHSTIVLRRYVAGEKLIPGTVVVFDRGDYPRVLHVVVEEKGDSYYLSGYNNRVSDGWFNKSKVSAVLVAVVRAPAKE